jgi:hypothetical protein
MRVMNNDYEMRLEAVEQANWRGLKVRRGRVYAVLKFIEVDQEPIFGDLDWRSGDSRKYEMAVLVSI